MRRTLLTTATVFGLVVCALLSVANARVVSVYDPVYTESGQSLKAVYMFPHWWDPWKSDDAALTADLKKISDLGVNTLCLDHEVSQAVDRDWYWLDREYKLAGQEKLYILPWLQLQSMDRKALMAFSHLQLKAALNQEKMAQEDCISFMDDQAIEALAHYISVYLDRYEKDPALLKLMYGKTARPVVGIMLEAGWRDASGQPLSFDDESTAYFRKWMKAEYHDLNDLNKKWGTSYKSFDEIDPCDKTIFNYAAEDKANMPEPVKQHTAIRARIISNALESIERKVRKRHKDVAFAIEVAYPFASDDPKAVAFRWNDANEYRTISSADVIFIRTLGDVCSDVQRKQQESMILDGKKVILAYRLFDGSTPARAAAFAMDAAMSANGLAFYNWNEKAETDSALADKPEKQPLVKQMAVTYDMMCNPDKRKEFAASAAPVTTAPAELAPVPVLPPLPAEGATTAPAESTTPATTPATAAPTTTPATAPTAAPAAATATTPTTGTEATPAPATVTPAPADSTDDTEAPAASSESPVIVPAPTAPAK